MPKTGRTQKYNSAPRQGEVQSYELIFVHGRKFFRSCKHLKINFMTSSKFLRTRKVIARLLVAMLYDGRYSTRNLGWIYRNYAGPLLGVSFETFSSYLDYDDDPLDDAGLPLYLIDGLWRLVNVPRTVDSLPADLLRRLARMGDVKVGYVRKHRPSGAAEEPSYAGSASAEELPSAEKSEAVTAKISFADVTV